MNQTIFQTHSALNKEWSFALSASDFNKNTCQIELTKKLARQKNCQLIKIQVSKCSQNLTTEGKLCSSVTM